MPVGDGACVCDNLFNTNGLLRIVSTAVRTHDAVGPVGCFFASYAVLNGRQTIYATTANTLDERFLVCRRPSSGSVLRNRGSRLRLLPLQASVCSNS
jgi:hypothetical protein